MPAHRLETDLVLPVRSRKTIYIRFDLNDYSIPPSAVGRTLTLVASEQTVRILDGSTEIARHLRSYDRHHVRTDPAHQEALLAEKRQALRATPSGRLLAAVPETDLLDEAFQRGEPTGRQTAKLVELLDLYGAEELQAPPRWPFCWAGASALRGERRLYPLSCASVPNWRTSMSNPITRRPMTNWLPMTTNPDLMQLLHKIGLVTLAGELEDFLARATKGRWSPRQILEELARREHEERAQRSLKRRLRLAKIGRFKPMDDFDWNWPTRIDREVIERAFTLDFIQEGRNLILLGTNGLGKTMIIKNLAYQSVLAGYSVLFRTASEILDDLQSEAPELQRRKLKKYARVQVLYLDEVGYLTYDSEAADLLYEIVNRRYECRSLVLTSNKAFKEWQ